MKQSALIGWSSIAVLLVGGYLLWSQPAPAPDDVGKTARQITAIGEATVAGKPDSARLYLAVVTNAKTVPAAREENARAFKKVREALSALKLTGMKSKTSDMKVSAVYARRDIADEHRIVGYEASNSFTVLLEDPDPEKLAIAAGQVLDTALEHGVNVGDGISFFKADDSDLQHRAMTKAVQAALANAKAYAAGADLRVAHVVTIDGDADGRFRMQGQGGNFGGGFGGGGNGFATSLNAGQWQVTATVRVTCRP